MINDVDEVTTSTLWACQDCLFLEVNGDGNPEWSEEEHAAHLDAMTLKRGDIKHYTPGSFVGRDFGCEHLADEYEEHAEQCERQEFCWSACDLCGSTLGGSRHAFTGWFE